LNPKFAIGLAAKVCELRVRGTSVPIPKFASDCNCSSHDRQRCSQMLGAKRHRTAPVATIGDAGAGVVRNRQTKRSLRSRAAGRRGGSAEHARVLPPVLPSSDQRAKENTPTIACPLGFISRREHVFGSGAPPRSIAPFIDGDRRERPGRRLLALGAAVCTTMRRDKAVMSSVLNLWNESRTNRARIADSAAVGIRSRPHLVAPPAHATRSCKPCNAVARRNVRTG
jgi:hypothetical protein